MRPRTAAFSSFSASSRNPGPGSYNMDALSIKKANCYVSTIRNYGVPLIKSGKRFNTDYIKNSKAIPGPG